MIARIGQVGPFQDLPVSAEVAEILRMSFIVCWFFVPLLASAVRYVLSVSSKSRYAYKTFLHPVLALAATVTLGCEEA